MTHAVVSPPPRGCGASAANSCFSPFTATGRPWPLSVVPLHRVRRRAPGPSARIRRATRRRPSATPRSRRPRSMRCPCRWLLQAHEARACTRERSSVCRCNKAGRWGQARHPRRAPLGPRHRRLTACGPCCPAMNGTLTGCARRKNPALAAGCRVPPATPGWPSAAAPIPPARPASAPGRPRVRVALARCACPRSAASARPRPRATAGSVALPPGTRRTARALTPSSQCRRARRGPRRARPPS